ncbi:hypothetical protein LINPERHAP2_LOCUS8640 [Linum perenne]
MREHKFMDVVHPVFGRRFRYCRRSWLDCDIRSAKVMFHLCIL